MAGFPQIPEIRGDTDDDASIHLFSRVGPSKPLAKQKYDQQIMDILRGESSDNQGEFDAETLNAKFYKFAKHLDENSDSDTQVEDSRVPLTPRKRVRPQKSKGASHNYLKVTILPIILTVLGFLAGLVFVTGTFSSMPSPSVPTATPDLAILHERIDGLDKSIKTISKWSSSVDAHLDHMEKKQATFIENIKHEIEGLDGQLGDLATEVLSGHSNYEKLRLEIEECRENLQTIENLSGDPEILQQRISEISSQLTKLSNINDNLTKSKSDIIAKFVEILPQHVPIYMKKGQIHYLPEFQKFLFQFVEKFDKSNPSHVSWDNFIADNEKELSQYFHTSIDRYAGKLDLLPKKEFEAILNSKLSLQESATRSALNGLIEKLDLSKNMTHLDVSRSSNKIVLEGLIDVISKGSLKVNYADYKLGSRILGFLTSTGRSSEGPSFARKLFLGWYDYFASSSISASNSRFNANTILVDGGTYWQCASSHCSVGIKLSTPIVLTDIILRNPSMERPAALNLPTTISIFVKPRRKHQAKMIKEYTSNLDFQEKSLENKYAAKFLKIQEVHLANPSSIEHIKLPVSLINMEILVRDLYIEIKSHEGSTGLFNLKAYGLTEFNSLKLNEQFNSVLDILGQEEELNKNLIYFDDDESF